jgi:hypothetical protein
LESEAFVRLDSPHKSAFVFVKEVQPIVGHLRQPLREAFVEMLEAAAIEEAGFHSAKVSPAFPVGASRQLRPIPAVWAKLCG